MDFARIVHRLEDTVIPSALLCSLEALMRGKVQSVVFGFCVLLEATLCFAHHKIAEYYDLTKPIVLNGTVKEFIRANPHSFILLDVKNPAGNIETWAVEGDGPNNLIAAGWDLTSSGWDLKNMLRPGDTISVTAFPEKAGARLGDTVVIDEKRMQPPLLAAMKRVAERQQAGRMVHGTDVTLSDGRKLLFGEAGR
jgi:hypothetical protein